LHPELQLRILKLTHEGGKADLHQLAKEINISTNDLQTEMEFLRESDLISEVNGVIGQDGRQRMALAGQLIRNGLDPKRVSRYLSWQEFEDFGANSLEENGFRTVKHLVFKIQMGRREIDLLAWSDTFLLAVDCKHWLRGLGGSQAQKIAQAQIARATALAEKVDLLKRYGVERVEKRNILPIVLTLNEPREVIVEGIPIVSVSKMAGFLHDVSPLDGRFRMIPVGTKVSQSVPF
jgi:Holliday junction resolvase-like predicted endonuclease